LYGNEEKGPVSATCPRAWIGYGQKGLDLGPGQKLNLLAVIPLRRYGQNALRQGAVAWLVEGHIMEKRMKSRQSNISAAGGIATFFLQVIEERAEERGIQILDLQDRGRLFQTFLGKREE
jgi:hypothetical protein